MILNSAIGPSSCAAAWTCREFNLYNWRGGGGSLWFAPVSQARGSETLKQMSLAKQILGQHGLDYTGEFIVGMRDMHHILDMVCMTARIRP